MKNAILILTTLLIFSSCASMRETRKKNKEDKEWIEAHMRKPAPQVIINEKSIKEDDYKFNADYKRNDSTMFVISATFQKKAKKVKYCLIYDDLVLIARISNGGVVIRPIQKPEYHLKAIGFIPSKNGKKSKQMATDWITFTSKKISDKKATVPEKSLNHYVTGNIDEYKKISTSISVKRKSIFSADEVNATLFNGIGLDNFSVNGGTPLALKGLKKEYSKTLKAGKPIKITVKDLNGEEVLKTYYPFNSKWSKIGSFLPFYEGSVGYTSFKVKNPFYEEWYKTKDIFTSSAYGLEWHKYIWDSELEASVTKFDKKLQNGGRTSSLGGEVSITGLFFSPTENNGLILGLGFYSYQNNFRFSSLVETANQPLFVDTLTSVFYDGSVYLSDTISFKQFSLPLKIGWRAKLNEHILWSASLSTSVLTIQKGGVLNYGRNNGLEGLYYPESKTLFFTGNTTEYEAPTLVNKTRCGLLDDLKVETYINFQVGDFCVTPMLSYNLNKVNDIYWNNSFVVSMSLNYRIWW